MLSFHPLAVCELDEAAHYYESRSTGLRMMFVDSVEACTESILAFPDSGRLIRLHVLHDGVWRPVPGIVILRLL